LFSDSTTVWWFFINYFTSSRSFDVVAAAACAFNDAIFLSVDDAITDVRGCVCVFCSVDKLRLVKINTTLLPLLLLMIMRLMTMA